MIGFIGIGAMGSIMAENLLEKFSIAIYNRSVDKCQSLVDNGAILKDSPLEIANTCDFVVLMVSDNEACIDIVDEVLRSENKGLTLINMSTISPKISRELSEKMIEKEMHYIEAPVAGSLPQARSRQLLILVGGAEDRYVKVKYILEQMGKPLYLAGVGTAAEMKLIINANLAIQTAFLSETILLARNSSISVDKVLEIFNNSALATIPSRFKSQNMLSDNYDTAFSLKHLLKDIRYALEMGKNVNLPILSLLEKLYSSGDEDTEDLDFSAIMKIYNDKIIH